MSKQYLGSIKSLPNNNIFAKIINPLYVAADAAVTIPAWYAISQPIYHEVNNHIPHSIPLFLSEYVHDIRKISNRKSIR
jgi:hypothetical protein